MDFPNENFTRNYIQVNLYLKLYLMMKALLFLLQLIPALSFCQSIGLKGGFNISNIKSNSSSIQTSAIVAPSFGIAFFPGISKVLDLCIEPTYVTFGGSDAIPFAGPNGTTMSRMAKVKYRYIEVPVSLNFYPLYKTNIVGIHAGMSPMYFLSKKEEFSIASTKLNDFVFAPFVGGTFGYKFAKRIFFHLVARYQFPMSNIYKDAPYTTKFKSVNFFVILACRF